MRRRGSFWPRLVRAPLVRRKSHALLSLVALGLGACLVTALLTLYTGVEQNLSSQFRRYGANLVVTPAAGAVGLTPTAAAPVLAAFPDSVGVLYAVADSGGRPLVMAGADLARLRQLNAEWRITGITGAAGSPLPGLGQAWVGQNAARVLHLGLGGQIQLSLGGRQARWRVVGIVSAGTDEDSEVMAPLAAVAALAARTGYTTLQLHVTGGERAMAAAVTRAQALLPGAEVEPVRQIAKGEGDVLLSTRSMLLTTTLLILLTVGLCVAAALTTLALERRQDFALMKALGGSDIGVMAAFVAEAALLGLAAAVGGIAAGAVLAAGMGQALFGVWLAPSAAGIGIALAATLTLAAIAALLPWPIVRAAAPAAVLKEA
ncbi:MAG: ABC transporter permease [Terriglobales bacterium]